LREPLFPVGCGLAKLDHFVAPVKISGRCTRRCRNTVFRKSRFGGG